MKNKLRLLAKESAELTYLSLLYAEKIEKEELFSVVKDYDCLNDLIDEHLCVTLKIFYKILHALENNIKLEEYNND